MNKESWRPRASRAVAVCRAEMLRRAREFFGQRRVLEVDTPILNRYPVTDPHIASMSVRSSLQPMLFLHTSPEYRMKQLLAAGFGDIYQIGKVFRDGELGGHHLPEFTLVEWYRLNFDLRQMMQDTIEFIAAVLDRAQLGTTAEFLTYDDAFRNIVNLDPWQAKTSQLAACLDADGTLRASVGDDRDAWLDLVLSERIVPAFTNDRLTVIYHYPKSQAALARVCADNANLADRFEVFYGAIELANGFVELTDADEQLARFEADQEIRQAKDLPVHEIDKDLIGALKAGLPACAGVALGFDRLLMLREEETDIAAVTNFPD